MALGFNKNRNLTILDTKIVHIFSCRDDKV